MPTTIIHIKNMVCDRCIWVVKQELEKLGFTVLKIKLGEAELAHKAKSLNRMLLHNVLNEHGFELLTDQKAWLVEKIKTVNIEEVHRPKGMPLHGNFSSLIQERVGMDYHYLASLFSRMEGITMEKYVILQRIERVKELLTYNELTLAEIANVVGYSSVAYLSAQFKKITGYTTSKYKISNAVERKPLDKL